MKPNSFLERPSWKKPQFLLLVGFLASISAGILVLSNKETYFPSKVPESDTVIQLERTLCFGTCPVYKLTVYGDGTVIYKGENFVSTVGTKVSSIDESDVQELLQEIEQLDYFSLNSEYDERDATDAPSTITTVTIGSQTKSIYHYYGDLGAPTALTRFEANIDRITNAKQWITPCSLRYPNFCASGSGERLIFIAIWSLLALTPFILAVGIGIVVGRRYSPIVSFITTLISTILLNYSSFWIADAACNTRLGSIDFPVCHLVFRGGYLSYSSFAIIVAIFVMIPLIAVSATSVRKIKRAHLYSNTL